MSLKLITAPERGGRTFVIAVSILGTVGSIQLVVVLWALLSGTVGRIPNSALEPKVHSAFVPTPEEAETLANSTALLSPAASPSLPAAVPAVPTVPPPPAMMEDPAPSPVPPVPAATKTPHEAHRIDHAEANALFDKALRLREEGDTQGALTNLKSAEALVPRHPMILAELATTYQQMGQDKKSVQYWEAVHQMGAKAGAYWDLANMALSGKTITSTGDANAVLQITRHTAQAASPAANESERIVLKIHLKSSGEEQSLRSDLIELRVFFYDLVNESNFERSVAITNHRWPTQPYDWREGGEEIIEVDYMLPKLTNEEQALLGSRSYYGYIIELYYHDVLQDMVANPRKLARFGQEAPPMEYPGSSLFPNSTPGGR